MTAVPIDHSHRREPMHRRTMSKVRRNSRPAGRAISARISREEANRRMLGLAIIIRKLRQPGQRYGAHGTISRGAADLYRLVLNMAVKLGNVEPSAAWLARQLNVAVRQVHVWKGQLKAHGFLDWQRRYVETGRDGVRGPQVEQTTNAYVTRMPAAAEAEVARLKPPASADEDTRKEERWRAQNPGAAAAADLMRRQAEERAERLRGSG